MAWFVLTAFSQIYSGNQKQNVKWKALKQCIVGMGIRVKPRAKQE